MMTRRDIVVALVAVTGTLAVVGAQQPAAAILKSQVFDWGSVTPREVAYGSVQAVFPRPDGDAR